MSKVMGVDAGAGEWLVVCAPKREHSGVPLSLGSVGRPLTATTNRHIGVEPRPRLLLGTPQHARAGYRCALCVRPCVCRGVCQGVCLRDGASSIPQMSDDERAAARPS